MVAVQYPASTKIVARKAGPTTRPHRTLVPSWLLNVLLIWISIVVSNAADSKTSRSANEDPTSFVDLLIGTLGAGHVYPGPTLPFGSVKPGLDTYVVQGQGSNQAGFIPNTDLPVFGISALHDDGTGGLPSLGISSILPQYCQLTTRDEYSPSNPDDPPTTKTNDCKWSRYTRAQNLTWFEAKVANFTAQFQNGINLEFSATQHTVLYHFDFNQPINKGGWSDTSPKRSSLEDTRTENGVGHGKSGRRWRRSSSSRMGFNERAYNLDPVLIFDHKTDLQGSYLGENSLRFITMHYDTSGSTANGGGTTTTTSSVEGVRIVSSGTFRPSFGVGNFSVFSCLDVPFVKSVGTFQDSEAKIGPQTLENVYGEAGAILVLDQSNLPLGVLPVRLGISWKSTDQACRFAEQEVPNFTAGTALNKVGQDSKQSWNDLFRSSIQPTWDGVPKDSQTLFWSSLYRVFLSPNNVTGDNPLWGSDGGTDGKTESIRPSWDSIYCLWDSARVLHPLWTLLIPETQAEFLDSLLQVYENEGWLPDCRMSFCRGFTQGGSNSDMVLADGIVKGLGRYKYGQIDWETALRGMLKNAEVEPQVAYTSKQGQVTGEGTNNVDVSWATVGRGGIAARRELGYVPRGESGSPPADHAIEGRTASRTIEYAYNDFSIALLALKLGHRDIYNQYKHFSNDWQNLWNNETTSDSFKGFLQAKFENGQWSPQDPRKCSPAATSAKFGKLSGLNQPCFLSDGEGQDFYEASSWQYSFFAPHDMARVVTLMGGPEEFLARYDRLWANSYGDIGDEPGFLTAFVANYAPQGYRHTVDTTLKLLRENFNTSANGLPGNDDAGSMASYVVWNFLGMFPVSGTGVYLLSTPLIPYYSLPMPNLYANTFGQHRNEGKNQQQQQPQPKAFTLKTINFDNATQNKYITRAWLNDKPYTKNWICHSSFVDGDTLVLELGPEPSSTFGAEWDDTPPSISRGGGFNTNSDDYLGC